MNEPNIDILEVISRFSKSIDKIESEEDLLWYLAQEMVAPLGFEDCVVYKINKGYTHLEQRAAFGPKTAVINKEKRVRDPIRIPMGYGITGFVAMTKRALIVEDVTQDARYIPDLVEQQFSEIAVPIVIGDQCYGVIDCEDNALDAFGETHLQALSCIAAMVVPKLEYFQLQGKFSGYKYIGAEELQKREREFVKTINAQKASFQSEAMSTISQLSAGLAHDINNQLAVMRSGVDLAVIEHPQLESHLTPTLKAIDSCATLTHQMLAFSSQQTLFPNCVNLSEIVSGMEKFLKRSLGRWITVRTKIERGLWSINIDQSQFERALLNLAVNARDAMPSGGRLSISCYNVEIESELSNAQMKLPSGQYVAISVGDTGTGMSDFVSAHACEPFFTTKKKQKGTGLGLSQVYGFVRQSGGELSIHSKFNEGTVIKMLFPKMDAPKSTLPVTPKKQKMPLGEQQTILVIEDDTQLSASLEKTLKVLGYKPLIANTAQSARDLFSNHPDIELILSDIMLDTGVRGHELCEDLRELGAQMPFIFMSGFIEGAEDLEGVDVNAENFLQKPFSTQELSRTISQALNTGQVIAFTASTA